MARARPTRPRAAAASELEQWVRTELRQRGPAQPAPPPSAPPRAPWFKLKGLGGGWGFVHGAGPMLEAVGHTLDWAQEILVHALLGNVPWGVVGSFLKLVLLPSGRRVEEYVTEQEFEALRTSVQLRVAAKKTSAPKKRAAARAKRASPSAPASKRPRATKKAAAKKKSKSASKARRPEKSRAPAPRGAAKKSTSKARATKKAPPSKKAPPPKKVPATKTTRSPAKPNAPRGDRRRGSRR